MHRSYSDDGMEASDDGMKAILRRYESYSKINGMHACMEAVIVMMACMNTEAIVMIEQLI